MACGKHANPGRRGSPTASRVSATTWHYFESGRRLAAAYLLRQLCHHNEALHGLIAFRTLERYNRQSSCYSAQLNFAESLAIHRRALIAFGVLGAELGGVD